MCGILGVAGAHSPDFLERGLRLLGHRGPDDSGTYQDPAAQVAMGMRRLAILDIAHGKQPMSAADGSCWIVFNGEIFNAPALRRELQQKGCVFLTENSDTEVLLHLYRLNQENMLASIDGMFAFVIYDVRRRRLFGARDRMGIKPFYYAQRQGRFIFSSEIKPILTGEAMAPALNPQAAFDYFSLGYVPRSSSVFQGIHRLPAGHCFSFDIDRADLAIRSYWKLPTHNITVRDEASAVRLVREGLESAVSRWTLSDVPIACSLSGGLDSSAVVALVSRQAKKPISTYSLGFRDHPDLDERPLARLVAERYHTDHHEIEMNAADLLSELLPMVWHLEEPYGGGLPSWYVFKAMAKDVKVGLTGTGGDELFGDYGKYVPLEGRLAAFLMATGFVAQPLKHYYFDRFAYFSDELKRREVFNESAARFDDTFSLVERLYRDAGDAGHRNAVTAVDFQSQLPEEFLFMTDRFSMAHSLEARVPLLDHHFVEKMMSIDPLIRTRPQDPKYLLRRAVDDLLPAPLLNAPKKGFILPLAAWLRGPLRPLCEALFAPERIAAQGIFQPAYFSRLYAGSWNLEARDDRKVWFALMFQLWHVVFVERRFTSRPDMGLSELMGGQAA